MHRWAAHPYPGEPLMLGFWAAASLMVFAALAFILTPMLRWRPRNEPTAQRLNAAIYSEQVRAIETAVGRDELGAEAAREVRDELDRQLLDDLCQHDSWRAAAPGPWLTLLLAAGLPVLAFGLYLVLGSPRALTVARAPDEARPPGSVAEAGASIPHSVEEMVARLEARMAADPGDADGWVMLGRSYAAMNRLDDARRALDAANRHRPNDPLTLTAYAEVIAGQQNNRLVGEPTRLIEQALSVDPDFPRALWLAGVAAHHRGEPAVAVAHWQRLLDRHRLEAAQARQVRLAIDGVRRAADAAPLPALAASSPEASNLAAPSLTVHVSLDATLRDRAADTDTVFVLARAVRGPRMPLAVVKRSAAEIPFTVTLDDSMAMSPELRVSGFAAIEVEARISSSGNAAPQPGDLVGRIGPLSSSRSEPIRLTIGDVVGRR